MRVLITGASGNLGSALAKQLAAPGLRLCLWGRNHERLAAITEICEAAGAAVSTRSLDISDIPAALAALTADDDADPFDLVLLVAGQGDTLGPRRIVEDPEQVTRMAMANFVAPAALAAEIGERMAQRKRGRIGIVGTAAASHSLPFAATYSASKAGLARFSDALRIALKSHGVSVTLISPGFFAASTTEGSRGRFAEIPASVVAKRMILAVTKGKAELITPWPFVALQWIGWLLPRPLRDRLLLSLSP